MTRLEHELSSLKQRAIDMGAVAESMVTASSRAIVNGDRTAVRQVLASEPDLDARQMDIDREVIRLIALYCPAARDLRFLVMMARINSELERIGDQAVDNCEYVELLLSNPPPQPLAELSSMSARVSCMLREALEAFREDDADKARAVMRLDDEIDAMNAQILREILRRHAPDREIVTRCVGLLIARSLERIADHATNICEEVCYVIKGEDIRHQV
jgi:phosphate transport system protein